MIFCINVLLAKFLYPQISVSIQSLLLFQSNFKMSLLTSKLFFDFHFKGQKIHELAKGNKNLDQYDILKYLYFHFWKI